MANIPEWRSMEIGDKHVYLSWVRDQMYHRWEMGREKYHYDLLGFQGDPLESAIGALLDSLFYLYTEQRRKHLEEG